MKPVGIKRITASRCTKLCDDDTIKLVLKIEFFDVSGNVITTVITTDCE